MAGEAGAAQVRDGPRRSWLVAWFLLAVLCLSYGLGDHALIEPDEGRNAEIAREMAARNEYLIPHLDGLPYLDKPFLYFAVVAAAMKILGTTETAGRVVSLLFSIATALLTGWFAGRLFGRQTAVVAAIAALTSPLVLALARTVIFDPMLSFFITLAVISFHQAVEGRRAAAGGATTTNPALAATALAWVAIALGLLTKGPVALLVPILVAAPYAAWRRASRAVWHPIALVPLFGLLAPFLWAVTREFPGFLRYVALVETWDRLAGSGLHRTKPVWFLPVLFCFGFFPWSLLAARGIRRDAIKARDPRLIFVLLWILLPLAVFSLSRSKMPQYILPLMPAVALLTAVWWTSARTRGVRSAGAVWAVFGGLLIVAGSGLVPLGENAAIFRSQAVSSCVFLLGLLALVGAVVAWAARGWGRREHVLAALSLPLVFFPVVSAPLVRTIAEHRSPRRFSLAVEGLLTPETRIIGAETYSPSISFYLERTIPLVSQDGRQLRSNWVLRNYDTLVATEPMILPYATFWKILANCEGRTVFLATSTYADLNAHLEAAGARPAAQHDELIAYVRDCPPAPDRGDGSHHPQDQDW